MQTSTKIRTLTAVLSLPILLTVFFSVGCKKDPTAAPQKIEVKVKPADAKNMGIDPKSKTSAVILPNLESDLAAAKAADAQKETEDAEEGYDFGIDPSKIEHNRTTATIEIPATWKRLGKEDEIWIDMTAKEVIIAGHVCLNQGALEMFICPEATKEHESVIAAHAQSHQVHAALVALKADPGKPTSWDPEYRAAYGPRIEVTLKWHDKESNKTKSMSAKQWIRGFKSKKAMTHEWVFGGSTFWEDPDSGEKVYYGDSGELICLSNFSTATIDLNVESSQSNEGLLFEAFTENIPPLGTKVYAIIKPGKRIEPK